MSIVFDKGTDMKSDPASNETKRYSYQLLNLKFL